MNGMTKFADQLWWDKDFIEKRIREQENEESDIHHRWALNDISLERALELQKSCVYVLKRFKKQLEQINKLK